MAEAERYLKCPCQRVYKVIAVKHPKSTKPLVYVEHIGDYEGFKDAPTLQRLDPEDLDA